MARLALTGVMISGDRSELQDISFARDSTVKAINAVRREPSGGGRPDLGQIAEIHEGIAERDQVE
jgi:hypothetical protein